MRTLVIGAGSIGSRRARLLREMGHDVYVVDVDMNKACELTPTGCVALSFGDWKVMAPEIDAAFVCTPAATHLAMANEVIAAGIKGLFIEKPLSVSMDGIPELIAECDRLGVVTMGACNMRWAWGGPFCQSLTIENSKPLSQWRAGASDAYGPNGIVLESAIHDMDVAADFVGPIVNLDAMGDEDHVRISLAHMHGGHSVIVNDWREDAPTVREMIQAKDNGKHRFVPDTSDEMYRKEMGLFLYALEHGTTTGNNLAATAETLRWALHARGLTRGVAA